MPRAKKQVFDHTLPLTDAEALFLAERLLEEIEVNAALTTMRWATDDEKQMWAMKAGIARGILKRLAGE